MASVSQSERIAAAYRRFAEEEVCGRSPLYERLAQGVAADAEILAFLAALPAAKRQPNLLLAAVRHRCGTARDMAEFRRMLLDHRDTVRAVMLARSTQTNEPGRCAALLPALAMLPQPLALIEVGASAGLCLLPDRYAYEYAGDGDGNRLQPADTALPPPVFRCAVGGGVPIPDRLPQIVWRAGLDLNPLDVRDPDCSAWLETLVWPEQTDRLARLRAAMAIAARDPPRLVAGDLRHDLAPLAAEAPAGATLVIFHTAVLAYVHDIADRQAFARGVGSLCDFWLANEAPSVFRGMVGGGGAVPAGRFLMTVNGAAVACCDPHGASLDWIADPPAAYTRLDCRSA